MVKPAYHLGEPLVKVALTFALEERFQQIIAEYIDPPFTISYTVRTLLEHIVGLRAGARSDRSMSLAEVEDHCSGKLEGRENIGKMLAGKRFLASS
jgi:hypothetical protein